MMNHVTYHHYGATILDAPIAELHGDMDAILNVPLNLAHPTRRPVTDMEKMTDCAAGTHTLTYRSTMGVPEIAEYVATWTLACIADAPHTTMVEWMREYRPAAPINHDQIRTFVSALIDQEREIALRFAAEYGNPEVIFIDYTLGGAVQGNDPMALFAQLDITEANRPARNIAVRNTATIGRDNVNDIVLESMTVSRCHALLLREADELLLLDLESANGTLVNGVAARPDTPVRLADGDSIRFGQVVACYRTVNLRPVYGDI
jgi:hypothetical protein